MLSLRAHFGFYRSFALLINLPCLLIRSIDFSIDHNPYYTDVPKGIGQHYVNVTRGCATLTVLCYGNSQNKGLSLKID